MKSAIVFAVAALAVAPAFANEAAQSVNPFQWSGFYFGAQVGYGMVDDVEDRLNPLVTPYQNIGGEGAVGGLFLGYNHFLSGNLLAGVEVEGNLSSLTGEYENVSNGGAYYSHDWSVAARVRFGVLPTPDSLLYASVGAALGHFDFSKGYWAGYSNLVHTPVGLQLGVGAETFVMPNLSVRGEAIYTRYASDSLDDPPPYWNVMPYSLTARVGLTYHPGWLGAPPAAVPADLPLGSWDGVYAGVQAGLTFLDSTERYDPSASNSDSKWDFSGHGASFGGHVGINRQVGMWVAGLEGDGAMQTDSFPYIRDEVSGKQTWSASVRARLGVLTAHNLLFYGTVGWAAAGFDYSRYFNPASAYAGTRFTAQGIQFGGGMEAFIARNVSARLEALYTNYGDHRIRYQGDPQKLVNPRNLEARVGVTYHFK